MVEEMLAARGICVTYETVRQWGKKFGKAFAGFVRVTAGSQRVAQHDHPQATFKPRGRATRPM
jgi:transposase-like protein